MGGAMDSYILFPGSVFNSQYCKRKNNNSNEKEVHFDKILIIFVT
jgi:hypothetical protein